MPRRASQLFACLAGALALNATIDCTTAVAEPAMRLHAAGGNGGSHAEELWPAARARGISRTVFDRFAAGFTPDPDVLRFATSQPEHLKTTESYLAHLVTEQRVQEGRALAKRHARLLASIEAAYGVDRHVLVAIWGVESAFGTSMGTRNILRSLATLALNDERRTAFWRGQFVAALRIVQEGDVSADDLVGSWAGATGHTQFIPSTYAAHAVDFDRDGRRDVWNSLPDALASTANYLRASGWAAGAPWGFEVVLPGDFDYAWSAPGRAQALSQWLTTGVRLPSSAGSSHLGLALQLVLPAGSQGPALLVTRNFRAILRYNNSVSYAIAVGHLADRIAGGEPFAGDWPTDDRPLARDEREEMQRLLTGHGHDTGGIDGIMGDQTRAAIRAAQRSLHLVEDGHPSFGLLQRLRGDPGRSAARASP